MKGVPIKFKAKAKRGGYVCGGVPSADDDGVIRFLIVDILDINCTHHKRIEIFPDTLQQLIGYDHYNNEVYEGDMLVAFNNNVEEIIKHKGRPKKPALFYPKLHCDLYLNDYVNVTGDYE